MPSMLSWINLADTAREVEAQRESTGLGARNLLTEPVAEVWRIPQTAGLGTSLWLEWAEPIEVGVIALFAPRDGYLPPGFTGQAIGSIVARDGSDVFNSGTALLNLEANRGAWWYFPTAPVTIQYLRLRFVAAADDGYLQFGRLWVGPTFRPAVGAEDADFRRGWTDAGVVERAAISGVASVQRGATARAPRWSLGMLDEDEADEIEDCAAAVGATGQIVANARTDRGAKDLVLGRFAAPPEVVGIPSFPDLFRAEIAMLEDL